MAKRRMGKNGWLWMVLAVLAVVGGIEHILSGFMSTTILTWFGSWSSWVQGLAGIATVWYVVYKQWMKRR